MNTMKKLCAVKTRATNSNTYGGIHYKHAPREFNSADQLRRYNIRLRNSRADAIRRELETHAARVLKAKEDHAAYTPRVISQSERAANMAAANNRLEVIRAADNIDLTAADNKWIITTSLTDMAYFMAHIAIKKYYIYNAALKSARVLYAESTAALTAYYNNHAILENTKSICYDLYGIAYISLIENMEKYDIAYTPRAALSDYLSAETRTRKDNSHATLLQTVCNSCRNYINAQSFNHGQTSTISIYASTCDDLTYIDGISNDANASALISEVENAVDLDTPRAARQYDNLCIEMENAILDSNYRNAANMLDIFRLLDGNINAAAIAALMGISETSVRRAIANIRDIYSALYGAKTTHIVRRNGRIRYAYRTRKHAAAGVTDTKVII